MNQFSYLFDWGDAVFGSGGILVRVWNFCINDPIIGFSFGLGIFGFALKVITDITTQKESKED